jgi:hypothetical protein
LLNFGVFGTKREDDEIAEMVRDHNSTSKRLKHTSKVFGTIALSILFAAAALVWTAEYPNGSWEDIRLEVLAFFVVGPIFVEWWYQSSVRKSVADEELAWLSMTLRNIKNNAEDMRKASIEEY